jgi:hypothetical protein
LSPWALESTKLLMPISRPSSSSSGPPELPGLIGV